jgi:hypothetical protein
MFYTLKSWQYCRTITGLYDRRISKYFKVEIFPTATTIYIYDILHSSLFVCVSSLFLQASLGNSAMLNTTATESLSQCPLLLSQFNAA